jgi:hypothetical protein
MFFVVLEISGGTSPPTAILGVIAKGFLNLSSYRVVTIVS